MNASTCIYMCSNIERNIMTNQSGTLGFGIQGKISMYLFFVSHHYIFSIFKNSFAGNLCTGLKPTFHIRVSLASRGCLASERFCSGQW